MSDTLQEAITAHQQGDFDTAKRIYETQLDQNPRNADVLHLLAILWGQQGDYKNALGFAEQAINIAPDTPTYYNTLGNILKHLERYEDAESAYRNAQKVAPDSPAAFNNLAILLSTRDRDSEAKALYQQAIKLNSNYADARFNLALLHLRMEDFNAAQQEFEQVLKLEPQHFEAHRQLGQLLQKQDLFEQAIAHYQKSLKIDANNVEATVNLGTALISNEQIKIGIETIKQALALEPSHYEAHYNLGTAYLTIKKPTLALDHFINIVHQKPNPDVFYNIGVINMYQDNHGEAIAFLKEALMLEPNYIAAHINLGVTYLKIDDIPNAIKHYKIVLQKQPNNKEVQYLLDALTQENKPDAAPLDYVRNLFDQYAPYFDKHLTEYLSYKTPELLFDAVKNVLDAPTPLSIVDLGCGTGLAGEKFKPLAKQLIGVDISQNMIDAATQKKLYDKLLCDDNVNALASFSDIDLVIAADVFSYQGDLTPLFTSVSSCLVSQGLFAFTVEKSTNNNENFELQTSARYRHSKKYLDQLCATHGFSKISCESCTLRTQKKKPIEGLIFICKKNENQE